jgi:hypothetical protein
MILCILCDVYRKSYDVGMHAVDMIAVRGMHPQLMLSSLLCV